MRAREFIIEDNPDYDEDRYLKSDPGVPLSFPKGTTLVNVSDVYDWYKLGMAVSDLDDADPRTFNKGVPHTVFAFGSEEEEHKMIPLLKRLGFSLHDIDSPEDYQKAIRADEAIAHLEEMISRQVINDDENKRSGPMTPIDPVKLAQLNQKINTDQADSTLPSGMDWTQQIGNTGSDAEGWQKAQGRVGDVNIGLAADYNHPQSNFAQQRGINLAYGPASVNIGDRGAVSGSYNIPVGKDSSVSLSASGQKEFGLTGVGAQYQNQSGFSAGVNQPNFPGAKPTGYINYTKQFEEALDEMAGKIHGGVRKALMDKGYKYLGGGIDKQAYLEPGGQVLIVFGYRPGNTEDFSPDQRMFIDWINYCNANKNNPNLPRFSGFESFEFQGKNYIQARMEALQELSPDLRRIVHYIDQFTDQIGKRDFDQVFAKLGTDAEAIVRYLGGRQSAERLLKTVHTVDKFGRKHGYSLDLHSGNYMQRADGTIVVNDPFVHWMDRLGS